MVLLAVPGAFTPTCSEKHLPGFLVQSDALKAKGVQEVLCLSVNDKCVRLESLVSLGFRTTCWSKLCS